MMLMLDLGVLVLTFQLLITPALSGKLLECKDCQHVENPEHCKVFSNCTTGCITALHYKHDKYLYAFRCAGPYECLGITPTMSSVFGKRTDPDSIVCRECCTTDRCESAKCLAYPTRHAATTHAQTTHRIDTATNTAATTTSTHATPIQGNSCRDYETETFRCSEYDKFNLCTDTSSLAHAIAHDKCAKYCGLCGLSTTLDIATATTTHRR